MKRQTAKRLAAVIISILTVAISVTAQDGLGIGKIFDKYGHSKGCRMVEMNNTNLHGHSLRVYKSLTYKRIGNAIETMLKEDRRKARKIREVVDDGRITSGYYMMPPLDDGINRYILFSKGIYGSGAVIYIEGRLSPDDIMQICYAKKRR